MQNHLRTDTIALSAALIGNDAPVRPRILGVQTA